MLLDISNIGPEGIAVDEEIRLEGVPLEGDIRVRLAHPRVRLRVARSGRGYGLEGQLTGTAWIACVRCLAEFALPLFHDFHLTLVRRPTTDGTEPEQAASERAALEDDVDSFAFDGNVVDVASLVREQVDLCMPMKPLCRPDCRGLCAQCGADRNEGPCRCPAPVPDPRWAVLERWSDRKV